MAHNYIAHFHDGVDVATYGNPDGTPSPVRDRLPVSIDFYGNDIFNVEDNCLEADGGAHNIRIFRNRCFNHGHRALSVQPMFGGPVYFMRNLVYHAPEGGAVKFTASSAGIVVYHNTLIAPVKPMLLAPSNVHYRNNLILGKSDTLETFAVESNTNYSSSDYNGFRPNEGAEFVFEWSTPPFATRAQLPGDPGTRSTRDQAQFEAAARERRRFRTLEECAAATGQEVRAPEPSGWMLLTRGSSLSIRRPCWSHCARGGRCPGRAAVRGGAPASWCCRLDLPQAEDPLTCRCSRRAPPVREPARSKEVKGDGSASVIRQPPMRMLRPKKLQRGDTVAAVTLSWGGPGTFLHRYEAGKRQLTETLGVHVVEAPHALRDAAWLARNPEARANDLMWAFSNSSIAGVISTIGGDDSIRLVPHVDIDVIRSNPKVFLGYSDTTVSHLLCFRAGLTSFYGPSFMAGIAENGGMFPYTVDSLRTAVFSADPIGRIEPNHGGWTVERLDWAVPEHQYRRRHLTPSGGWQFLQGKGIGRGPLIGGCLEVLQWLRGTSVWPDAAAFDGAILFLETSEEAPSPVVVARELRVYAAMGLLRRLSAILFGRPGGPVPPGQFDEYDQAILRVVAEEEGLSHLPVVTRMDFGHTDPMFVLPYGVLAQVDCERQEFSVLESAVIDPGAPPTPALEATAPLGR